LATSCTRGLTSSKGGTLNSHEKNNFGEIEMKFLFVFAAVLSLSLTACDKKPATPTAAKEEPVRPVRTLVVTAGAVGGSTYLPAEVRPRYEQRYAFRVGGKIAKRLVDVGQSIQAGQTLAIMDSTDVMPAINAQNAQVDSAKTDLALQQVELKRVQDLASKGFVSSASLDRQKATAEAALSRLKAAQAQLTNVSNGLQFQTLKADKAGVVLAIDAEAGTVVAAGQSVVRAAQLGEKELLVNVPESSVNTLRSAKAIAASFSALPGKVFSGRLRELAPSADPATRTYAARFSLEAADPGLSLGMSGTVQFSQNQATSIVVPNTALYTRDNTVKVWLVDKASQTVKAVAVKLGASTNDGVVIETGLKAGDIVVTAGANLLLAGQKVKLFNEAAQ
jgi:membrane fusion protein, multidrug efflux system